MVFYSMGKINTIYLSNEEVEKLEKFCEENRCTQYSAMKMAIRELFTKRLNLTLESSKTINEKQDSKQNEEKKVVEKKQKDQNRSMKELLLKLISKEDEDTKEKN